MISLFIKIYKKQKLCTKLIEEFYKINKDKKNDKNLDRKESLNDYISTFSNISSEADNLIKNNNYNDIQFYGILLCYLNYYDYENFQKYFNKLNKEKSEILYEILIIYNSNFIKPIEQDLEFFINFIKYTISKKEFDIFENILDYILDIETFIKVIDETKEQIIEKYVNSDKNEFKIIKIKDNLALKKKEKGEEIDIIIDSIKSIIEFSEKNDLLLIYFTINFWKNLLKHYNEPNALNINIYYRLREKFNEYNDLLNKLSKNEKLVGKKIKNKEEKMYEKKIKDDINKYFDRDEFAFVLDKNIKFYFEINKEISNDEILGFIKQYDPYYNEDRHKYRRETNIFDYINFDQIDKQFIETFKKLEFEIVFKGNINDFLNKIISKIDNIYKFSIIIELIDINKIAKAKQYLSQLKHKFDYIVKKKIHLLTSEKLNETIKIIAKFANFLFIQEKNYDFLEQKIDKLNKKISPLVYNELMRICQGEEYQLMREYIYKKHLN